MSTRKTRRGGGFSLRMLWFLSVVLVVGNIAPVAMGQGAGAEAPSVDAGKGPGTAEGSGLEPDARNSFLGNGVGLPSIFPIALEKNFVSRFSLGEAYESGIRNGKHTNGSDTFSEATASLTYNLRKQRTEYVVDYKGSARHYRRYRGLDALSHDLGFTQIRQLSPHLSWNLSYRYSLTPDYNGGLLRESLPKELSFVNPLPAANLMGSAPLFNPGISSNNATFVNPLPVGVKLLPTTVDTLPQILSPGDGLLLLRSVRMTNHASAGLNYELNSHTTFFSEAGFQRMRFQDANLFGANSYSLSAGIRYLFSPRTELGGAYQGWRNDVPIQRDRLTSQGFVISFHRQLTRTAFLTVTMGPLWTIHQGQKVIPLSPLLSDLLGRPSLYRDVSQPLPSWMGSLGVSSQWQGLNLGLKYDRSTSSTYGLGASSLQQRYSASVGKQMLRGTSFSVNASYTHSEMIAIRNPLRFNQLGLDGTFTHRITGELDFVVFVNYLKILNGLQNSILLNHSQSEIRLLYHFPRVRQM